MSHSISYKNWHKMVLLTWLPMALFMSFRLSKVVVHKVCYKETILENFLKFTRKHLQLRPLFSKAVVMLLLLNLGVHCRFFFFEFWEISQISYFIEHLRTIWVTFWWLNSSGIIFLSWFMPIFAKNPKKDIYLKIIKGSINETEAVSSVSRDVGSYFHVSLFLKKYFTRKWIPWNIMFKNI